MKDISYKLVAFFMVSILIINIYTLKNSHNSSQSVKILTDSIQKLNENYYSVEDVFAYAYMNSDRDYSIDICAFLHKENGKLVNDKTTFLGFEWYVYVPISVCPSCLVSLCEKLKSENIIEECAFIIPFDKEDNFKTIINEIEIPQENLFYAKKELGISIERENVLFMFTLSSEHKLTNIYTPDKNLENLTEVYINVSTLKNKNICNIKPIN